MTPREALDRIADLCGDREHGSGPGWIAVDEVRAVLAEVSPEPGGEVRDRYHGHPFEVVIPCMTLEEANAEKADLHAAVEARAFIRPAGTGGVLDRDQVRKAVAVAVAVARMFAAPEPPTDYEAADALLDAVAGCAT